MKKRVHILGIKTIPIWLLVLALVVVSAGAAAGTILAGKVTGEVPVAVSQALLVGEPTSANELIELTANGNGVASWSSDYASSGDYSAKLVGGTQTGSDYAAVVIPINGTVALDDIASLVYTYTFASNGNGSPHVGIYTHDPANGETAEISLYSPDAVDLPATAGAHTITITPTSTDKFFWYGTESTPVVGAPAEGLPNMGGLDTFIADAAFANHVIDRIQIEYGWWGAGNASEPAYVDDITINGFVYPLDMGDLGGIDTVPQGTQRHYDTPNRYIGVVSDDNTAFQFASEVAVGDMYLIALPLKNASENDLYALLTLNVPNGIEVEVMSADQVHGDGNVQDATRIGTNTWKFGVLSGAEYNWLTDNLYVAISLDDDAAPGYYTISGTIKQIPY